jgi:putative membrane protein
MTWWCSAQTTSWDWAWQPYVGVWALVALLLIGYGAAVRGLLFRGAERLPTRPGQVAAFVLGVLVLWIAADWPLGPLGAGYLASVHMVQYLLFTMVAPPLLLHGTPTWLLRAFISPTWANRIARFLSRPLMAFVVFNFVMLGTHLPTAVDGLTVTQVGSFAVDMAWLLSGLVFWWQVLGPLPELRPLPYPGRIVFLLANVFLPTVPASFLTFADYPIYALYELAPRVGRLSATQDQQLAGMAMKLVGGFIIFGTASVLFFKWYGREQREEGIA